MPAHGAPEGRLVPRPALRAGGGYAGGVLDPHVNESALPEAPASAPRLTAPPTTAPPTAVRPTAVRPTTVALALVPAGPITAPAGTGPAGTGPAGTGPAGPIDDVLGALVGRAQGGDAGAFEELVTLTHHDTYTLALRLTGNVEDARDVTQEAYLRAFRSLGGFRGESRFSTWMYRITANCAATHMGRRRRHRHDSLGAEHLVVDLRPDNDPQLHADALDLHDRLVQALDQLPPKLRAVVVLRDVYELPHEAIAEELGISVTAAKVRLHRARHRLRASLYPEAATEIGTGAAQTGEAQTGEVSDRDL